MSENVRVTTIIAADPQTIYEAWLDSEAHAAMTGSAASSDAQVGGEYSAWDGYISGRYLELEPSRRIVAAWRSSKFPPEAPDSLLEVILQEVPEGTELVLVHTELPEGQSESYEQGWSEFYFEPMKRHFQPAKPAPTAVTEEASEKAVAKPRAPRVARAKPVAQAAPAQAKPLTAAKKPKQQVVAAAAKPLAAKPAKKQASGKRKKVAAKAAKKPSGTRKKVAAKAVKKSSGARKQAGKKASKKAQPKRKQAAKKKPAKKKPAKRLIRRR